MCTKARGEEEAIMGTSTTELFKLALNLSERDRAALAGLLIESLEGKPDEGLESAWKAEVEQRIPELDSGKVEPVPWEEVRAMLLRKEDGQ